MVVDGLIECLVSTVSRIACVGIYAIAYLKALAEPSTGWAKVRDDFLRLSAGKKIFYKGRTVLLPT